MSLHKLNNCCGPYDSNMLNIISFGKVNLKLQLLWFINVIYIKKHRKKRITLNIDISIFVCIYFIILFYQNKSLILFLFVLNRIISKTNSHFKLNYVTIVNIDTQLTTLLNYRYLCNKRFCMITNTPKNIKLIMFIFLPLYVL